MVRHINADGFRDVSRTMSVRREILKLFLKWKLKWVDKMTAGTVGKMSIRQMVSARLSNGCKSLESSLPSAISGLGSEWPIPAELSRWCTNTGTAVYVIEMKLYLFVRVASTANLWCDKQKLIKKNSGTEQEKKKDKI